MKKIVTLLLISFLSLCANLKAQDTTNFWQEVELPENIVYSHNYFKKTFGFTKDGDFILICKNETTDCNFAILKKKNTNKWDTLFFDEQLRPYNLYIQENQIFLICANQIDFRAKIITLDSSNNSWIEVFPGNLSLPDDIGDIGIIDMIKDSKDDLILCIGAKVLKSNYLMDVWEVVFETVSVSYSSVIYGIIEDTTTNSYYLTNTNFNLSVQDGVFMSSDNFNTWEYIGLGGSNCMGIILDKDNDVIVGNGMGVFKFNKTTKEWRKIEGTYNIESNIALNSSGDIAFADLCSSLANGMMFILPYQSNNLLNYTYNLTSYPNRIEFDNDGCMYLGTRNKRILKSNASSISNISKEKYEINIFPNPFNEQITIKLNNNKHNKLKIELVDILGKVLYYNIHQLIDNRIEIDTKNIPIGIYICKVSSGTELISVNKIVKTK